MSRRYDLGRRAERMEELRDRIVDAALALHGELGPARTTISAIARRAGVSRPTVYAQFPDERALFAACGARFDERQPVPALDGDSVEDVLRELYAYYEATAATLGHVVRDAQVLPALAEVLAPFDAHLDDVAARLAPRAREGRTVIRLAFELGTWERLAADGLTVGRAAALMARLADCAASTRAC